MMESGTQRMPHGFTLIELLAVMVIIGILAAIAIPKYQSMKERAHAAELVSDLRNVTTAEESYYHDHSAYASDASLLFPMFEPTAGNTVTIVQTTPAGWSAKITSTHASSICAIFFSVAPVAPATTEGIASCQ